jgi:hypothetical protein
VNDEIVLITFTFTSHLPKPPLLQADEAQSPLRLPLTMVVLNNDAFITRLNALFAARTAKGSVFISQKRCGYPPPLSTFVSHA